MIKKYLLLLLIIPVLLLSSCWKKGEKKDEVTRLYEQGLQKIEEKNYQGAVEVFTKVIEINPKYRPAYAKRGAVKTEFLKQHREAIADLDRAIELNSTDAISFHNRGLSKINIRDYEGAVEDLSQAVKLKPTYYIAHNSRGTVYGMLGEYEKALKNFESTITIKPDYLPAHINKIYAFIKMEKYDEAQKSIEEAKKLVKEEDENSNNHKKLEYMVKLIEKVEKPDSVKIIRP